jgi:hypothetical protein
MLIEIISKITKYYPFYHFVFIKTKNFVLKSPEKQEMKRI